MTVREQILALRTPKGGFTRETLSALGVPWPPPKGWLKQLVQEREEKQRVLNRSDSGIGWEKERRCQ